MHCRPGWCRSLRCGELLPAVVVTWRAAVRKELPWREQDRISRGWVRWGPFFQRAEKCSDGCRHSLIQSLFFNGPSAGSGGLEVRWSSWDCSVGGGGNCFSAGVSDASVLRVLLYVALRRLYLLAGTGDATARLRDGLA